MIKVKHITRITINSFNMAAGFLIISFACTYNKNVASFYVSLVASVILGTVSSFGESTVLGFCKGFPSSVVGYFGSGTGFAGVFGAGITLILQTAGLSNGTIFFIIAPSVIPYFIAFWWINNMKRKYPYIEEQKEPIVAQTYKEDDSEIHVLSNDVRTGL
jgi:battenin